MPALRGLSCALSVNVSPLPFLPPIWATIGGQRDASLLFEPGLIDVTNKDSQQWQAYLSGVRVWSLRFTNLLIESDVSVATLDGAYRGGQEVALHLRTPQPLYYQGQGVLTQLSTTMPHANVVMASGTLLGASPLIRGGPMENTMIHVGVIAADAMTESTIAVGATTTAVVPASTSRQYLLLVNVSDTDMYLSLGGNAAALSGLPLYANGGSYEMSIVLGNLYAGAITAIHAGSGSKSLVVLEGDLG